ncbi:hypothetical protein FACS1894198_1280 [Clostridia bacterium]|nr:hypothetical protein FACS1894198_1280 [Clostridia bacterium]
MKTKKMVSFLLGTAVVASAGSLAPIVAARPCWTDTCCAPAGCCNAPCSNAGGSAASDGAPAGG